MNLTKSFLEVCNGKLFGFIITSKGIHLDPDKIKEIRDMQPQKNLKEHQGLSGRLAYIQKFSANSQDDANHLPN